MPAFKFPFIQNLSSNGDGTGITNFAADYSSTEGRGYIKPGAGIVLTITKLSLNISDDGKFERTGFGVGAALTNGITISANIKNLNYDYITDLKSNDDVTHTFTTHILTDWATKEDTLTANLNSTDFGDTPFIIQDEDTFNIYLNDDLSGLVKIICTVAGYKQVEL